MTLYSILVGVTLAAVFYRLLVSSVFFYLAMFLVRDQIYQAEVSDIAFLEIVGQWLWPVDWYFNTLHGLLLY